jgi:putative ABC transport system permease protein
VQPDIRWRLMGVVAALRGYSRALFTRGAMDHELDEEVRFHLEMEIEKNVRAGMSLPEARRKARVAFGGVDRMTEAHRDARGARLIEDLIGDARYAARALGRTPGFIAVSILTLAVAVSIGTLGFTAANAFFYRPLPVPDGEKLISVFTSDFSRRQTITGDAEIKLGASSYADVMDFARGTDSIADLAGESRIMLTLAVKDEVAYVQGGVVTSDYFRVARVRPALGNFPATPDIPSIVISHMLWRRTFAADPSIVGSTIRVNGQPFVIAGVAPTDFRGINRENGVDFWIDGAFTPIVLMRDELITRRGNRSFRVTGRLREGHSLEELNARLSVVAARLFQAYPQAWRDTTGGGRVVMAQREQDAHLANVPRTERLLLIAGVVGFGLALVVIACMNLASMQMARGASRRREIATRLALGAGRGRLIRQLLAECGLVAVPGIVLGVAMAVIISGILTRYRPIPLPSWDLTLDWRAMAFIVVGLAVTLFVFGLMPALQTVKADVVNDLKGAEQPGAGGLRVGGLRGGLIVAQVALSVIFTASAGLVAFALGRHANETRDDARTLLVTRVNFLPAAGDSSATEAVLSEMLDGIRGIPGVRAASAAYFIPIRGTHMDVMAETQTASAEVKKRALDANLIRPGYLAVMGLQMLRGRDLDQRDFGSAPGAIVTKAMSDALWPGEDPMGKRIKTNDRKAPVEVVGVAADPPGFTPATDHSYPGMLYLPMTMSREAQFMLHVRVSGNREAIAGQMAEVLRRYNRQLVAPKAITLDEYYDSMLIPLRLMAQGSGVLATMQFLLAVAGLSGLVAYVTERRRREIGIRTALGASRASVLRLVMRQGVRLTALGGAIGLAVSVLVARVIAENLTVTPVIVVQGLLIAAAVFGVVGTVAMLIPARRALNVAPAVALRVD